MPTMNVIDPDNVPEMLVAGPFTCTVSNGLATLTFTHERVPAERLMAAIPDLRPEAVVRARLVIPEAALPSLRDILDRLIRNRDAEAIRPAKGVGH
jgi:hypothetical protein